MGDLEGPETEHSRYSHELNTIIMYYDSTTEIGKVALKWREDFKVSVLCYLKGITNGLRCELRLARTPYELRAYKTRVAARPFVSFRIAVRTDTL
jgi:hypothetical protein